jgi:hypothetical protein
MDLKNVNFESERNSALMDESRHSTDGRTITQIRRAINDDDEPAKVYSTTQKSAWTCDSFSRPDAALGTILKLPPQANDRNSFRFLMCVQMF